MKLPTTFYESLEALQEDLDAWLEYYNRKRSHQGYRSRGKRPYDTLTDYLQQRARSNLTARQEA